MQKGFFELRSSTARHVRKWQGVGSDPITPSLVRTSCRVVPSRRWRPRASARQGPPRACPRRSSSICARSSAGVSSLVRVSVRWPWGPRHLTPANGELSPAPACRCVQWRTSVCGSCAAARVLPWTAVRRLPIFRGVCASRSGRLNSVPTNLGWYLLWPGLRH